MDWIIFFVFALFCFLVGALSGRMLVGLLLQGLKEPEIGIELKNGEFEHYKAFDSYVSENGVIVKYVEVFYTGMRVRNIGSGTLKNVEVVLEALESPHIPTNTFQPLTLAWLQTAPHTDPATIRIPEEISRVVNICKIGRDNDLIDTIVALKELQMPFHKLQRLEKLVGNIEVCSLLKPDLSTDILSVSEYYLYLSITADNAVPLFVKLKVAYDHVWSEDPKVMFNQHLLLEIEQLGNKREEIFN